MISLLLYYHVNYASKRCDIKLNISSVSRCKRDVIDVAASSMCRVPSDISARARRLAIAHVVTGTLMICLGALDGFVGLTVLSKFVMGVWSGVWVSNVCGSFELLFKIVSAMLI